jgi:hypothetical protein
MLKYDPNWYQWTSYVNVMATYPLALLGAKGPQVSPCCGLGAVMERLSLSCAVLQIVCLAHCLRQGVLRQPKTMCSCSTSGAAAAAAAVQCCCSCVCWLVQWCFNMCTHWLC